MRKYQEYQFKKTRYIQKVYVRHGKCGRTDVPFRKSYELTDDQWSTVLITLEQLGVDYTMIGDDVALIVKEYPNKEEES